MKERLGARKWATLLLIAVPVLLLKKRERRA